MNVRGPGTSYDAFTPSFNQISRRSDGYQTGYPLQNRMSYPNNASRSVVASLQHMNMVVNQ